MNLIDRAKNICLSPATEWTVIDAERSTSSELVTGYVLPLVGISALANFIGNSLVGRTIFLLGSYRVPIVTGLGIAVFTIIMTVISVFVLAAIVNALAPTFSAQKSQEQAMKIAVYSFTPAWIAGILQVLPALGILVLLGSLYGIYICYLGLPRVMKCPQDKAVGYTAVTVICAIVISVIIGAIAGSFTAATTFGVFGRGGSASDIQADPNSALGRLQQLGQQAEQAGRAIESAGRAGDPNAQAAAAAGALGALLGGGSRVDPVSVDTLKPLVPETFAGLPRTSSNAERSGIAGIMVAKAEARYGEGDRTASLEVQDTGGVSGLVGLASWMGAEGERETDSYAERNGRVNGRLTHERMSKTGDRHEYSIVLADRFIVNATGRGMTMDELKAAVNGLDLAGIEALRSQTPP